jgi:transcriptional regulator with XRE-family HTH domain
MALLQSPHFDKEEARRLRKAAGEYIKSLREERGMTQLKLAQTLGYSWYSYVSQIESGANRVPSESMEDWARVLDVDAEDFAVRLLSFYDPFMFKVLKRRLARGKNK